MQKLRKDMFDSLASDHSFIFKLDNKKMFIEFMNSKDLNVLCCCR